MSNSTCGFKGNSDIYGVGIRIGYYTQALTAWFSNFFVLREANDIRAVNGLFLFALLIVILIYSHNAHGVYAIEDFLLIQIGLCLGSVSIMDSTRYSTKYIRASKERLTLKLILLNAGLAYNFYFWWFGLDAMQVTPCGTYAFYFARANLYGRMRIIMKVLTVFGIAWRTLFTTLWEAGKALRWYRIRPARVLFVCAASSEGLKQDEKAVLKDAHLQVPIIERATTLPADFLTRSSTKPIFSNDKLERPALKPFTSDVKTNIITTETNRVHLKTTKTKMDLKLSISAKAQEDAVVSFSSIWKAEKYLDNVLSAENSMLPEKKPFFKILGSTIYIRTPKSTVSFRKSASSFIKSTFTITWSDMNTRYIRDTLSIHSKAAEIPTSRWPFTVDRILERKAMGSSPDWEAVAVASDVKLSQMPLIIPRRIWVFKIIQSLLIIVILVVQIELTIVWNRIQEIQNLSSIGQLIPLIIGIGGFTKVCWSKWRLLGRSGKEEDGKVERTDSSDYEEAMEKYLKWKKKREDLLEAIQRVKTHDAVPSLLADTPPLKLATKVSGEAHTA